MVVNPPAHSWRWMTSFKRTSKYMTLMQSGSIVSMSKDLEQLSVTWIKYTLTCICCAFLQNLTHIQLQHFEVHYFPRYLQITTVVCYRSLIGWSVSIALFSFLLNAQDIYSIYSAYQTSVSLTVEHTVCKDYLNVLLKRQLWSRLACQRNPHDTMSVLFHCCFRFDRMNVSGDKLTNRLAKHFELCGRPQAAVMRSEWR